MNFNDVRTLDIVKVLESKDETNICSDESYQYLSELISRQIVRLHLRLSKSQQQDLSHTVCSNMLMFLKDAYCNGFKVSNWLKYTYNKTLKHYMAIYDLFGNEKPEVIEVHDVSQQIKFINLYYLNDYFADMQENIFSLCEVDTIGHQLFQVIEQYCRYNSTYKRYHLIINSVFISICLDKDIYLYGLKPFEKHYVFNLTRYVRMIFPDIIYSDIQQTHSMITDNYNEHLDLLINREKDNAQYYI